MRSWFTKFNTKPARAESPVWHAGIADEIAFWDQWLQTGGEPWPHDFRQRCDPETRLQEHITEVWEAPPGAHLRVLDVGAGPLTYLGKHWPERTLQITAVDPLADEYDRLLQKFQIEPPIRTRKGDAEELIGQFPLNSFNLVHARNCIDHSYDPLLAIRQMVAVTKPGGLVYMHHAVNEAETQQYYGFHQWNLYDKEGDLYLSNRNQRKNVTQLLANVATINNKLYYDGAWIITVIRKHNRMAQKLRGLGLQIFWRLRGCRPVTNFENG